MPAVAGDRSDEGSNEAQPWIAAAQVIPEGPKEGFLRISLIEH